MKNIFSLFLLFFCSIASAQFVDDFSDGDFSSNPTWTGNNSDFIINSSLSLQLFNSSPSSSNESFLSSPAMTNMDETTTWEFFFNLDFATSTSNYANIYLLASDSDLAAPQNGYYLRLGGISGDQDALQLYRQDGSSSTAILSGTAGELGNSSPTASVRITRSPTGQWTLWADYSGGTDYQNEGNAIDDTWETGSFIGIFCKYTSTRAEDMYFDNFLVSPTVVDDTPPSLLSANATNATTVILSFDEALLNTSIVASNFSIDNGIGTPSTANLTSPTTVQLSLSSPLTNLVDYTLSAENISDVNANIAPSLSTDFSYYEVSTPQNNEIIITEIMADPTPSVGLPDGEYIEIYNNSNKVFQLSDVGFQADASQKELPAHLLLPQQYIIICDDAIAGNFTTTTLPLSSFPALTNSGESLSLYVIADNSTINTLTYKDTWYKDSDKKDGGWSLELINLNGPYNCDGNWAASTANVGGTPGIVNSINGMIDDITGPRIIQAIPLSEYELLLTFNEAIDFSSTTIDQFSISPHLSIDGIFDQGNTQQILLQLTDEIQSQTTYELSIGTNITDCIGNAVLPLTTIQFGLPEAPIPSDLLINEILFNPQSGGKDFVEIYNASDKIINLSNLTIRNTAKMGSSASNIIDQDYLLFPSDYVVLTEDKDDILDRYSVAHPNKMITQNIPSFDDDEGNVTLQYNTEIIDSLRYTQDWHFSLLADEDGVSLERISTLQPTQNSGNWHSAASTVGYATPTTQNSQWRAGSTNSNILHIPHHRLSPDGDGHEDVLQIKYEVAQAGYSINLFIFDANGRPIQQLASNLLLASKGNFKWEGTTDDGLKARMGIYIVWAEIFHPDGHVEQFKETISLVGRL